MRRLHFASFAIASGLIARLAWALLAPAAVFDDAASYRAIAHALAEGRGYATSSGPTAYWTPGWAAWMSLFYRAGGGDRAIELGNVALGAVTIAIVWLLARELATDARVAWRAAAITALVPSLVILPGTLLSENLALPLVAIAALALSRARRTRAIADFVFFGVAAAGATWVRESCAALVLAGIVLACAAGSLRARATTTAAVVLSFSLLLAPWVARNRAAMGATTLTTSAGVNLCIGLGDDATGGYRPVRGAAGPGESELERHEDGLRCAERGLRDRPLAIVTLAPAKLSRLLAWDDWLVDDLYARTGGSPRAWLALRAICDLAYWALLAAAIVSGWRARRGAATRVVVAVALAVAASVLLAFGAGRFHTPLLPLLAVLAAPPWYRRGP